MEFNLHQVADNQFTRYSCTSVTIKDKIYSRSIIVTNNDIYDLGEVTHINQLTSLILAPVYHFKPDLVLMGFGNEIIYPAKEILQELRHNSIGVEVMALPALCRTYNFLVSEGRKVAGILVFE